MDDNYVEKMNTKNIHHKTEKRTFPPFLEASLSIYKYLICRDENKKNTCYMDLLSENSLLKNELDFKEAELRTFEKTALYDSLTGLKNRTLLEYHLDDFIRSNDENKSIGVFLMLDLDDFKHINDTLGHDAGDEFLINVAKNLNDNFSDDCYIFRFGGDEFVVVFDTMSSDKEIALKIAKEKAEEIRHAVSIKHYNIKYQDYVSTTVSIGLSLIKDTPLSVPELLTMADISMHESKKSGKNTVTVFDEALREKIIDVENLKKNISIGLQKGEFELYYQAQNYSNGEIIGAEALVRWNHEGEVVSPLIFIDVAEESGQIVNIGNFVLEEGFKSILQWQDDDYFKDLILSVNISAKQLLCDDFLPMVFSLLGKYKVDITKIKFELTESFSVGNCDKSIDSLKTLIDMGIKISLDDFGTGYSSLSYFKKLPLSQVKIDKSFVDDIETDLCDKATVKYIIDISSSIGLEVVAEGVETKKQVDILEKMGCKIFQGYYYAKPMNINDFADFVCKSKVKVAAVVS